MSDWRAKSLFYEAASIHKSKRSRKDKGDQEQELRLEATYHPLRRTLTIDSRSYYLADGNLFVIRFDGGMKPVVTQLDATINENVDNDLIFNLFKSLLRGDEAAQKLISVRDDSATSDCERRRTVRIRAQ